MKYMDSKKEIQIGDFVFIEDNARGMVVCDFDRKRFFLGYENWDQKEEVLAEGVPVKGVMIKSEKYGLVYYEVEDDTIKFDEVGNNQGYRLG